MGGKTKRSKVDLYATILEVVRRYPEGVKITRMSYGVGMPIDRLKVMVDLLCSSGLITRISQDDDTSYYCATPRGLEFLDTYRRMNGFLAVFGEDA